MDLFADPMTGSVSSKAVAGHVEQSAQGLLVSVPLVVFAVAIFMVEQKRRGANENAADLLMAQAQPSTTLRGMLSSLAPEFVGLLLVILCAWVDLNAGEDRSTLKVDDEVSREIKHDWPILKTADSLLGIQAMLRLLLLSSAVCRRTDVLKSPFAGMTAAFFFFAALCRVALIVISPADVYHLDGPLGKRNLVIEVAALPLLFLVSAATVRTEFRAILAFAVGVLGTATISFFNRFDLAGNAVHLDAMFSLVQLLELLAGVSFFLGSLVSGGLLGGEEDSASNGSVFSSFAHILLPMQQAFSMYYFLCAFAPPFTVEPELVGEGHPFEVLQLAGLTQVGMYIFAGVWHFSVLDKQAEPRGVAL